ncbi:protein IQ-DOMAIN 1-like [Tripterygium wilfordii]|uniref:Protein IQ-DOMAIN 1-like n=1 Tax=Tripterygium wilfordii TaxID=458696 RepID=A0A7J7DVI5_TRIWF|nr:protein IQ-DOMAIN 1-like [Tripterygium wilfordii]KAF5750382.1 protein IQ-DOMAIN 1-like [Tripterygium wilfordii]
MGRKGNWFSSVKKALSPDSKESNKSKKKWFGKQKHSNTDSSSVEAIAAPAPPSPPAPTLSPHHTFPHIVEIASSDYADFTSATVVAPLAAAEVVQVNAVPRFAGKSREEVAAIKIQTAFRGYLARRALRALRGLVRLRSLMEGPAVKRQATSALRCMQTLSRVQSQICSRRIRMSEENQALQKQLLQKHAKELENLRMGEQWDDSLQSKEQIEASLLSKYEAAMRRERAMAYAFSHQKTLKNSSRPTNLMFMDPRNPTWGWSWLERFMAARPWESCSMSEKELNNDHSSVKSASRSVVGGEICKSYARYQLNSEMPSPTASQKPSQTINSLSLATPSRPAAPSVARKLKPPSPRGGACAPEDDSKSMSSVQSNQYRRHSIAASSVRDDESLESSPSVPSYMVPTQSAKAKSRLQSPLGAEKNGIPGKENESLGSAKKRLSYPPSPAKPRRLSAPSKMESLSNNGN